MPHLTTTYLFHTMEPPWPIWPSRVPIRRCVFQLKLWWDQLSAATTSFTMSYETADSQKEEFRKYLEQLRWWKSRHDWTWIIGIWIIVYIYIHIIHIIHIIYNILHLKLFKYLHVVHTWYVTLCDISNKYMLAQPAVWVTVWVTWVT